MPQQYPLPPDFRPGSRTISAEDLNKLKRAIPSTITGDQVNVKRIGSRTVLESDNDYIYKQDELAYFVILGNGAYGAQLTTVTSNFDIPKVGDTITIVVSDSSDLAPKDEISFSDYFVTVESITDDTHIVISNDDEESEDAPIISGTIIEDPTQWDYLSCVPFNFSNTAQEFNPALATTIQSNNQSGIVYIAKPFWFRLSSFDGQNVENSSYTYTGKDRRNRIPTQTWVNSENTDEPTIPESIKPTYTVGDIIIAKFGPTGLTDINGNLITWVDMNQIGRHWSSADDTELVNITAAGPYVYWNLYPGFIVNTVSYGTNTSGEYGFPGSIFSEGDDTVGQVSLTSGTRTGIQAISPSESIAINYASNSNNISNEVANGTLFGIDDSGVYSLKWKSPTDLDYGDPVIFTGTQTLVVRSQSNDQYLVITGSPPFPIGTIPIPLYYTYETIIIEDLTVPSCLPESSVHIGKNSGRVLNAINLTAGQSNVQPGFMPFTVGFGGTVPNCWLLTSADPLNISEYDDGVYYKYGSLVVDSDIAYGCINPFGTSSNPTGGTDWQIIGTPILVKGLWNPNFEYDLGNYLEVPVYEIRSNQVIGNVLTVGNIPPSYLTPTVPSNLYWGVPLIYTESMNIGVANALAYYNGTWIDAVTTWEPDVASGTWSSAPVFSTDDGLNGNYIIIYCPNLVSQNNNWIGLDLIKGYSARKADQVLQGMTGIIYLAIQNAYSGDPVQPFQVWEVIDKVTRQVFIDSSITTSYTAQPYDVIFCDSTEAPVTITLPLPINTDQVYAQLFGITITVININSTTNSPNFTTVNFVSPGSISYKLYGNTPCTFVNRLDSSGNIEWYQSRLTTIIEITADSFVIPAVDGAVDVTITAQTETSMWDVVGVTILINDGTHLVYGWVSAIVDDTHFTFTLTRDATVYAVYNSGTTYAIGDEVILSGVVYTSSVDGNTGNEPDTSPDDWNEGATMAAGAQCIISGDPYPPFTDTPHNLLDGVIDQDTVAASVVEGDLVFGNATPKWDRLPIGSTSQILTVVDGLPSWAAPGEGSVTITTPDSLITNNFIFDDATLGLGDSGFMTTDGVSTLTFHDASASNSGTVNTSSQEFSGLKTFLNDLDVVDTVSVFASNVSSGDYSSLNYTALGFVLDNVTTSLITGTGLGGPYEASPFYGILESAAYSYWADGTIAYQAFTELTNLAFPAGAPTVGYDSDDNIIYGVSALWLYNNSTGGAGEPTEGSSYGLPFYAIGYGVEGENFIPGQWGTPGPGFKTSGGLVTDMGSGSFLSTVATDSGSTAPTDPGGTLTLSGGTTPGLSLVTVTPGEVTLVSSNVNESLLAQTANISSLATLTPTTTGTYSIGGWVAITAVSLDVLEMVVSWTDQNGSAQTATLGSGLGTTGFFTFPSIMIQAKASDAITISTSLTTSSGSISYDAGGTITAL